MGAQSINGCPFFNMTHSTLTLPNGRESVHDIAAQRADNTRACEVNAVHGRVGFR